MLERKLFFTRNGEYSIWEMLSSFSNTMLGELYLYLLGKQWVKTAPRPGEYPTFIYRTFSELKDEQDKTELTNKILECFKGIEPPKSDFNSYIFKFPGTSFDLATAVANVMELIEDKGAVNNFEIEGLKIELFPYGEINGNKNVLDVRFISEKSSYFKENENKHFLITEIRCYLEWGISLVTNFSDYTHSDSDKRKFISELAKRISSYRGELTPIKMSDNLLRKLLLMEDKNLASKLKFEIEGRLKVGVDIKHPSEFNRIIQQSELKYFYDNFPLSTVKIKISEIDGDEKYIFVYGSEGKLLSRAKNIDVIDIDNFVKTLSKLLHYDYLNHDYLKEMIHKAKVNITGTNNQKENAVRICYKEVEDKIQQDCNDITGVFVSLIKNAFFYCLSKKIILVRSEIVHQLKPRVVNLLAQMTKINQNDISNLYSILITAFSDSQDNLEGLLDKLNFIIHTKRVDSNASGF